jgi:hypothetical protein
MLDSNCNTTVTGATHEDNLPELPAIESPLNANDIGLDVTADTETSGNEDSVDVVGSSTTEFVETDERVTSAETDERFTVDEAR